MRKSTGLILLFVCIAMVMIAGCSESKPIGTYTAPTTISGKGDMTTNLVIPHSGSYNFHVISKGNRAGMIVTIEGGKEDLDGKILYSKIVDNAYASGGIDGSKRISGFAPDTYKLTILTINNDAPWTISISTS
ncbi:MAG: hypothetical protein Q7T80_06650 [Methanoregula sp.]|nr:hypothetical protein [Methanoregula sp.]